MATTPDFMLGIDAKIYYTATPGSALSTFTLILDRIQDVSLKISTSDADITTRANSGWKATVPTLKEAEVSFGMVAQSPRCRIYGTEDGMACQFRDRTCRTDRCKGRDRRRRSRWRLGYYRV